MSEKTNFAALMPQVAELVLGEFMGAKNKKLSNAKEWRWGDNGSLKVNLETGIWSDFENDDGGGVLDLLKSFKGLSEPDAIDWLVKQGLLKPRQREGEDPKPEGKFAGFMDDHPIAIFKYFDDVGALAYEVLKFSKSAPRRYMQRRPHPAGGWIWALIEDDYGKVRSGDWFKAKDDKKYEKVERFPDAVRWLYHRAEVLQAIKDGRTVFLCEGEKDVETLRAWGFVATTNAGGAKYWSDSFDTDLTGAHLILMPDNDAAGRQRALLRGASLRGKAKTVKVLDMALHWKDMPEKKDVTDWRDETGGTKEAFEIIAKRAPMWKPERPKSKFGGISWSGRKLMRQRLEYLVEGWLTTTGMSFMGGLSSSGKSFLALHLALCLARGQDFFGLPVRRCGVVYQAGEGGLGLLNRMEAYAKHFKVDDDEDIPFELLPSKINIFSKESKDVDDLINEIKSLSICMSHAPGLLVIDTLSKAAPGADEISGKDNGVILENVARIERECRIHVMLVHHLNADGKKLRGHTSLRDNVDQVILIDHDKETGIRKAVLEKIKDGESGKTLTFTLFSLPVHEDNDSVVTSCVVTSVSEKERLKKEQAKLGFSPTPTQRRILENMFRAIDRHGRLVGVGEEPKEAQAKVVVDWASYRSVTLDTMPEAGNTPEDREKASDKIAKEFARAKDDLLRYGVIGVTNRIMWWKGKPIRGFRRTLPLPSMLDELEQAPSPGMLDIGDGEIQL